MPQKKKCGEVKLTSATDLLCLTETQMIPGYFALAQRGGGIAAGVTSLTTTHLHSDVCVSGVTAGKTAGGVEGCCRDASVGEAQARPPYREEAAPSPSAAPRNSNRAWAGADINKLCRSRSLNCDINLTKTKHAVRISLPDVLLENKFCT